jgi:hypothetical protein
MGKKVVMQPAHPAATPAPAENKAGTTADVQMPVGMVLVDEAVYNQLAENTMGLLAVNNDLKGQIGEYQRDLRAVVTSVASLAPLVGDGGFSPGKLMALISQKDALANALAPLFAVYNKYAAPADKSE